MRTWGSRLSAHVEGLTPAYFAWVMASGIVSLGLDLCGYPGASWILFALGVFGYALLIILNLWRLLAYRQVMIDDLFDPHHGFGYFTFVAGTDVLAARAVAEQWYSVAGWLLLVGGIAWLALGYAVPWVAVLIEREHRPVVAAASGRWFLCAVASQSVAVVAAGLEKGAPGREPLLAVLAVVSWAVGLVLYMAAALFVSLRLMLYPLRPTDMDATYWVSMGAIAITVVAGAQIIDMSPAPMIDATRELIRGTVVVLWAFGTWLIPVLVAAGFWRHVVRRVRPHYGPSLWSMIFPFGMYAVACVYLGRSDNLPLVEAIGTHALWVSVVAYAVTMIGMIVHVARVLLGIPGTLPPAAAPAVEPPVQRPTRWH